MNKYTVVLLRPDYLADEYGKDIFSCHVYAKGLREAIVRGQEEVYWCDRTEDCSPIELEDYHPLLVYEGHINSLM